MVQPRRRNRRRGLDDAGRGKVAGAASSAAGTAGTRLGAAVSREAIDRHQFHGCRGTPGLRLDDGHG